VLPHQKNSLRLFRLTGIQVSMHWSWFLVAIYQISDRGGARYPSLGWNIAEYLALFLIVLMHEFGHSLACRSVGGRADDIVLWPLGGVAYVAPPQRPGAVLWSIAAGPLVNVVLVPLLVVLMLAADAAGWTATMPGLGRFLLYLSFINIALLVFNVLPVYPLDGGQMLRALLWFWLGRARSLHIASIIGFFGVAGLVVWAVAARSIWIGLLAGFAFMRCWDGFRQAKAQLALAELPRHPIAACPACHTAPPAQARLVCAACKASFDPFVTGGVCPQCQAAHGAIQCGQCGEVRPVASWVTRG
jgi:Zn-dependent protease